LIFSRDVTLICFLNFQISPVRRQNVFRSRTAPRGPRESVLILIMKANSGANRNLLLCWIKRETLLNGCSRSRNKPPHKNPATH
jgi:hypothetical protein